MSVSSVLFESTDKPSSDDEKRIAHLEQLVGRMAVALAYIATLQAQGVEISVAHRGRPWENVYAERLIRTLKEEEVDLNAYQDIHEARDRIGHFITQVYHQKRPHSALGYLMPMEFQQQPYLNFVKLWSK